MKSVDIKGYKILICSPDTAAEPFNFILQIHGHSFGQRIAFIVVRYNPCFENPELSVTFVTIAS
jgi:hypothetical protein